MHFCQEYPRSHVVAFSVLHVKRYTLPIYPINGDIPFDHLGKVVSARFLHCKITNLTFLISILLGNILIFDIA